jgi:hypothetical protein
MLVYHLSGNQRRRGTVITVACPKDLADEAIGRFRALTEPGYTRPDAPGAIVLTGPPGRVWIGGVLVTTVPGFLASYDLPLTSTALQNRDRTVIEADALRDAVRAILAVSQDHAVISRFATHVLADNKLREPEQFFPDVREPRTQAAWRRWAATHLPEKTFYTDSGTEEAALELKGKGFTELTSRGLARHQQYVFMRLLGVTLAPVRHREHREQTSKHMKQIPERSLTAPERAALTEGITLIRRAIGGFALDRVTVYTTSEKTDCPDGLYTPSTGDVAVNRDILGDAFRLRAVLAHEAAHRVTHRGGGRWLPSPDYRDRCRGFENTLGDFTAHLLRYVADGEPLPPAADRHATSLTRLAPADDPVVAVSRRELAHLLLDQLPHALAASGFTTDKTLIAATAVPFEYWRTLTRPKPAGFRRYSSGGQATNYERVTLIAEALGVHPPVVWLGYNLCEGSIHSRKREKWGQPGRWSPLMRTHVQRACTELLVLGGDYAAHVPALQALAAGTTTAPIGDESWQAPARTLIALERRRLGLDPATQPAGDHRG